MPYQTTKPAPTDDLDVSVTDIQQNFLIANTIMDINHYPFDNVTANKGKHKFVEMPLLAVLPTIATSSGGLYTKGATSEGASTETDLFYTPDASGNEYQLTRTITGKFSEFAANGAYGTPPAGFTQVGGWTYLPGGLLYQYGFYGFASGIGTSGTIQFPVTFTSAPYTVEITISRTNASESVVLNSASIPTTTGFAFVSSSSGTRGIYWHAVGK